MVGMVSEWISETIVQINFRMLQLPTSPVATIQLIEKEKSIQYQRIQKTMDSDIHEMKWGCIPSNPLVGVVETRV